MLLHDWLIHLWMASAPARDGKEAPTWDRGEIGRQLHISSSFFFLLTFLLLLLRCYCCCWWCWWCGVGGNNILGGWRTAAAFHPWVEWEGSLSFLVMESTGATERNEEPLLNPYLAPYVVVVVVLFFPLGETSHHHQTLGQMGRDI